MPSVWSTEATRAALADEQRKTSEAAALRAEIDRLAPSAEPWRVGLYWLTPEPDREGDERVEIWFHCHRCGVSSNVNWPEDLGGARAGFLALPAQHRDCPQTLASARWELLVTLRLQQHRLAQRKSSL